MKKKINRRKTKRIFHGPDSNPTAFWWDVEWENAKQNVVINGTLEHAINGIPGNSIGCRLSNGAIDPKNKDAFPHPVILAAFYKTTALIVDRLAKNGTPCHAILYEHDYSDFVDMNDSSSMEAIYKDKRFHLRVPRIQKSVKQKKEQKQDMAGINNSGVPCSEGLSSGVGNGPKKGGGKPLPAGGGFQPSVGQHKYAQFKGAMGRSVKAGLLGRGAASQLARAVEKTAA